MSEVQKPTIQIKTASPACPDIVGDWALGQKNPNESVKYLIIQLAAYFGNADIFDPKVILALNAMLSSKAMENIQPLRSKENSVKPRVQEEKAENNSGKTRGEAAGNEEKSMKSKKKLGTRPGAEPIGNMDIFDLKFINNLNSMFSSKENEKNEPMTKKEQNVKPEVEKEKAEIPHQKIVKPPALTENKEKKAKKKVSARPGTAPNIMQ